MDVEELGCFGGDEAARISRRLLDWYDEGHREMPWRWNAYSKKCLGQQGHEDQELRAYSVWVSEMMLQQTRVDTVRRYYDAWMRKWPSLNALAEATQEEVNLVWAGLGYYRRARFLLEGAKYIMQKCDGVFPKTVLELQKIPGVGKYTAGAIASIAFEQPVPVVDGNVVRVLSRLRAVSANTKESSTMKHLWDLAEKLVDRRRPGDLNQALMELGAIICTPSTPSCHKCPVSDTCTALAIANKTGDEDKVTDFPVKPQKPTPRQEYAVVCVVERKHEAGPSFLFVQRPKNGLLAGLWEFPSVPLPDSTSSPESRRKAMTKYLEASLGLFLDKVAVRENVGNYTHVFSHIRLSMFVERLVIHCDESDELKSVPRIKWVNGSDVMGIGLTSGVKKVYQMVVEHSGKTKRRGKRKSMQSNN